MSLRDYLFFLKDVEDGVYGADKYIVNKFGRNPVIPNGSLAPVCVGGIWRTPSTEVTLELLSDDADDTVAGAGARVVQVYGIRNVGGVLVDTSETVNMAGTAPVALANTWLRITRLKVIASGTYATASTASQKGTITLRASGGGETWASIDEADAGFGTGQSQIGATTIPEGFTGTLMGKKVSVDSVKTANIYFWTRENIDIVTPPYGVMQLKEQDDGVAGTMQWNPKAPLLTIPEKTDCGFMALGNGATASVSVDFQILVEKN